MAAKNDITGDLIITKHKKSVDFDERFDAIFGKRDYRNKKLNEYPEDDDPWDEARLDVIGQNGPTGLHYLSEEESND